jgi:UDP-N-acetylmuramoylalanine--D-glutamate ligase
MIKDWKGQRILIVGAARQGLALARYLSAHGADVLLNDQRQPDDMQAAVVSMQDTPVQWLLGSHPSEALDRVDCVCVSGGVSLGLPMLTEAVRRGLPLTNDSQIFLDLVPCPTIGITGSAGKTTTTTLVGRMAAASIADSRRVWVGGNIGQPLIQYVDQMKADDLVVLELSSFQLELMTTSPHVSAILNITPNHLDRHGTMEAYTAAKARILDYQTATDVAVLNREDLGSWNLAERVQGKLVSFGLQRPASGQTGTYVEKGQIYLQQGQSSAALLPREAIRLRGEHNLLNALAACAIATAAGLPQVSCYVGVAGFAGVPHRLEYVRTWKGADWYNDSIATAPERSMAAIRSFSEPLVLLAGGRDKKLPWDTFADLVHQRVDHLVIFGEAREKILQAVGPAQSGSRPFSITVCENLSQAVAAAANVVEPGDVVLLSPGGTSFDEFNDFEERGERFVQWVKDLS